MRFFLFDRVIDSVPGRHATGVKNVSAGEDFLIDHYARRPVMPVPLIIESLAQLGGWAVTVATDYAFLAVMVMVKDIAADGAAGPGDQIVLRVSIDTINEYGAVIAGTAQVSGKEILRVGGITYVLYAVPEQDRASVRQRYEHYSMKRREADALSHD
jgi:3-hydroxyacyl-[acyl-carrier-protein] dehydratase